jgi:hypothetical protein
MDKIKAHNASVTAGAEQKFNELANRAGKGVGFDEVFNGEGQRIEAPSTNQLIDALVQRVEQYEKDRDWSQTEFDSTKAMIEKKLADPAGLTATDIEILQQLQQRINLLIDVQT